MTAYLEGTAALQASTSVPEERGVDHGLALPADLTDDEILRHLENVTKIDVLGSKFADSTISDDPSGKTILEKHNVLVNGIPKGEYIIRRQYDPNNRLVSIAEGASNDQKTTFYKYRQDGNLEQLMKPNGVSIDYKYNQEGLLEEFNASDDSFHYAFEYDQLHQLVAIHDRCRQSVQYRRYNANKELIEEVQSPGIKVGYHYDSAGRQTGLHLPDNSQIAYHYDDSLLVSVDRLNATQEFLYSHTYEYDEYGFLKAHLPLKGIDGITLQYDSSNQRQIGISSPWWVQKIQDFDPDGRVLASSIQDSCGSHTSRFSYTENGQLAEEEGHQYAYDSLYNLIGDQGEEWEINCFNQLIETTACHYVYDLNGNMIEKRSLQSSTFYSYDALDRLIRIENPKEFALTYVYDAYNRRIEQLHWGWDNEQNEWCLKTTEKLIYDGFKEIGKVDEQGQLVELRILGKGCGAEMGAAIALELHGKLFFPIHDIHGSVRCLIDAETGTIAETYSYTAFGIESLHDGNGDVLPGSKVGNPWRFCSKRVHDQSGLISFGRRDYVPQIGRWMTPDPLYFSDLPNLYAFSRNDPVNCTDLYGLVSMSSVWDTIYKSFFTGFKYLQVSAHKAKMKLGAELTLPDPVKKAFDQMMITLFGATSHRLMGPHYEETQVSNYGERELSDKVRVTFINGILNTNALLEETLSMISKCHGGVKLHYVFRPSEGWTWDISRGIMIKLGFILGFRTLHAHLLAQLWRVLIQDMGGVEGGGTIIHYAHSLGGSETDRARELLTPEEQKMIRVITFGSATLVRNEGFQSVINHVSVNDGVSSIFLEPLGHIRNFLDPDSNVRFHGSFFSCPCWPTDHLLNGPSYDPILRRLGEDFVKEFDSK